MWYILTIILAIIGSIVAWAGEPMGAIGFIPMLIASILYDVNHSNSKKE